MAKREYDMKKPFLVFEHEGGAKEPALYVDEFPQKNNPYKTVIRYKRPNDGLWTKWFGKPHEKIVDTYKINKDSWWSGEETVKNGFMSVPIGNASATLTNQERQEHQAVAHATRVALDAKGIEASSLKEEMLDAASKPRSERRLTYDLERFQKMTTKTMTLDPEAGQHRYIQQQGGGQYAQR